MIARSNIYIDGFNLYYGSVRGTPYKWLDLDALCRNLLPGIFINGIRYFTALVRGSRHDPNAPQRQSIYLRALRTIPNLTIERGHFVAWPRLMPQFPLAYIKGDTSNPPQRVQVLRQEEKGSDVNLATHLLVDCLDNDFDEAVVISNDSDLVLPIHVVTKKLGKQTTVINPTRHANIAKSLSKVTTRYIRAINRSVLSASQFTPQLQDTTGVFRKPASW